MRPEERTIVVRWLAEATLAKVLEELEGEANATARKPSKAATKKGRR